MNGVLRRLFRAFVDGGGDLNCEEDVERVMKIVDMKVALMPRGVRLAMELVLRSEEQIKYDQIARDLSEMEGEQVTTAALRQRVSGGMRELERAIEESREPE